MYAILICSSTVVYFVGWMCIGQKQTVSLRCFFDTSSGLSSIISFRSDLSPLPTIFLTSLSLNPISLPTSCQVSRAQQTPFIEFLQSLIIQQWSSLTGILGFKGTDTSKNGSLVLEVVVHSGQFTTESNQPRKVTQMNSAKFECYSLELKSFRLLTKYTRKSFASCCS